MQEPQRTPQVGDIVLYRAEKGSPEANNGASVVPAIIVRYWPNLTDGMVNLKVFTDGPVDTWMGSVKYSQDEEPRSWWYGDDRDDIESI